MFIFSEKPILKEKSKYDYLSVKEIIKEKPSNHYTSKIFYIPLFICLIIFFILNIIGI